MCLPFNYGVTANTVLHDVPFLALPDIVKCFDLVRATEHNLHIASTVPKWLRAGAPRLFHHTDMFQSWLQGAEIPAALIKYFTGELTRGLVTLLRSGKIENRDAPEQAVQACRAPTGIKNGRKPNPRSFHRILR